MATRTIGGNVFTVSPLTFEASCDLQPLILPALADLARLYAVFIGQVTEIAKESPDIGAADVISILPKMAPGLAEASSIIAAVASKLPPEHLRRIRRTLLAGSTMDGKPLYPTVEGGAILADVLLKGRTIDGWKLLLFALEESYPDFFALLRPLAAVSEEGGA
jgi:hypothetical protein